jgi:hypothetical protein
MGDGRWAMGDGRWAMGDGMREVRLIGDWRKRLQAASGRDSDLVLALMFPAS